MKSLDFKSVMIAAVLYTAIVLPAFLNANCDFIAMLAKDGYQISEFVEQPGDFDDPCDFFQFQRTQSHQGLQNDGYGVIYYKNNSYTIPYDRHHPFDPLYQNLFYGESIIIVGMDVNGMNRIYSDIAGKIVMILVN